MSAEALKNEFLPKYQSLGDDKFYKFLLAYAVSKLANIKNGTYKRITPDLELLEYHNYFLILYRKEGKSIYLNLAKLFRKASHRIYRLMLRQKLTERNLKFLNLV